MIWARRRRKPISRKLWSKKYKKNYLEDDEGWMIGAPSDDVEKK